MSDNITEIRGSSLLSVFEYLDDETRAKDTLDLVMTLCLIVLQDCFQTYWEITFFTSAKQPRNKITVLPNPNSFSISYDNQVQSNDFTSSCSVIFPLNKPVTPDYKKETKKKYQTDSKGLMRLSEEILFVVWLPNLFSAMFMIS